MGGFSSFSSAVIGRISIIIKQIGGKTMTKRKEVIKAIERNYSEMVETLQDLVRIPSIVGNEGEAQKYVENLMKGIGLDVNVFEANKEKVSKHPAYVEVPWSYEGRPNVVGTLKGNGGRSIILTGHIDVVSAEPVSAWKYDPWSAILDGNRLYGRGSFDMKAGLCANIFAVKSLIDAGIRPKGDVLVASTVEEEAGGGGGVLSCLMEGYTADALMTTEPISKIAICHPGILYFRIKVKGRTIHAARAHLGINAIGKMLKIYEAIDKLDVARAERLRFPMFERDSGRSCNINIGTLKAGDWVSTVPGTAEMECRMSFVQGETEAQVKAEVENTVAEVAENDEWLKDNPPEVEWFGWHADPWTQDEDHEFVKIVKNNSEEVMGAPIEVVGKPAGMDTRFAQYFNMPALSFGPQGGNIHGIDEYVEIDSVLKVAKIVALTILDWCV
jgi:acetylornithine deacetylase